MGSFDVWVEGLVKTAENENEVNSEGKIPAIEKALECPIARKVATMLATSHEYKKPNIDGALAFVKNYSWQEVEIPIKNIQGIEKPIDQKKVNEIAKGVNPKRLSPLIVVDKIHGIRPQTRGKRILIDGHHRKLAYIQRGVEMTPVYLGSFTGGSQLPNKELRESE